MNADLERQLQEMGPECRALVARLQAAPAAEPVRELALPRSGGFAIRRAGWLAAASLLLVAAVAPLFRGAPARIPNPPREYALADLRSEEAVAELVATQLPDGGWRNDFLTRRNAEALSRSSSPSARIAYKKALRNLRRKGIL